MICPKCNKEVHDESMICPNCNEEIKSVDNTFNEKDSEITDNILPKEENKESSVETEDDGVSKSEPVIEEAKPKKFIFNKKLSMIIGSVILVIILGFVATHYFNENKYNKGLELLKNENYQEAYTIFKSLNSFNDASEKAEYAEKGIKYQEAKILMDQENYVEAIDIFKTIEEFENVDELLSECQSQNNYQNALALMEKEEYQSALDLFYKVDSLYVSDVNEKITECENTIQYLEAIEALANGRNYEAYKKFVALGDFKDAVQKVSECIVPKPKTGVIYHNDGYKSSACSLTIKPSSDGSSTYFKIYDETGEILVANIFINSGNSAKINLPAGGYILKAAYSFSDWFGEVDMFGNEGTYQKLKANNTSEVFTLQKNYDYTLTLRSLSEGGTPVPTKNIDKESF